MSPPLLSQLTWQKDFDYNFLTILLPSVLLLCCNVLLYRWIKKPFLNLPPGPRGLPLLGYLPFVDRESHKTFSKLRKKYGDIFGLQLGTQYTVIISDWNIAKETLSHPSALCRPKNVYDIIPGGLGMASLNGREWWEQRRFVLHAMQDVGLCNGKWEELIQEEVDCLIAELSKHRGQPIEIVEPFLLSLMNQALSVLLGKRLQETADGKTKKILYDFLNTAFKLIAPLVLTALYPWSATLLMKFHISDYHSVSKIMSKFNNLIREEISKHDSSTRQNSLDFIDHYRAQAENLNSLDKKGTVIEKNLIGSITSLFLGNADTNVSSLLYVLLLMAAYPEIQCKVQKEIDGVVGKEGKPRWEEKNKFPFTFAVMAEAQRWMTISPLSPSRCSSEDFIIKGFTIPKGTLILLNNEEIHNDPKHWVKPREFRPERFLSEDGKECIKRKNYNVFSFGKRNCPGETVALMSIFFYFASIMQKFTLKSPTGVNFNSDTDIRLVRRPVTQMLQFIPRE